MAKPHVADHLLAYVNGNLDQESTRAVKDHLSTCDECRREYEALNSLWAELGRSPDQRPGISLERGFHEMLSTYERESRQSGVARGTLRREGFLDRFLYGRPALQAGVVAAGVLFGLVCGYALSGNNRNTHDMAQLSEEVRGLRNLVAVSLLQQESASERLRGVSWSSRLEGGDPEISAALINTMNHDRNVNVRLAALNALSQHMGNPAVRREIIRSLPGQSSPLMQLALVDMLVQINSRESREVLEQALNKPRLHPDVQKRIKQGIQLFL